jgi:peptidoglycan/LPS O-acetylase OafA/YrhL
MPAPVNAPAARWYAPRLDVIRFVAFALVFVGHNFGRASFLPIDIKANTGPAEVFGVIIFFVLSAYLIGRLLLIERERNSTISLRRYWARRILRIWPLYFFLVIGVYAMGPVARAAGYPALLPTSTEFPYWLTFLENWAAPIKGFPGDYLSMFWTVCVEEQVYFLFPAILLLAWRPMVAVLCAMIVAGPLSCYLTIRHGQPYPAVWNFTTSHFDSFGLGLLLALLDAHRADAGTAWHRMRSWIDSRAGAAILLALTAAYVIGGGWWGPSFYIGYDTAWTYVTASLLAVGWVIVASGSRPLEWPTTRFMAWLGRRGYGLYAWHWPVLLLAGQVSALTAPDGLTIMGFFASLAATVLLAIASYRFLEVPFLRLRLRFQVVQNRL